MVFIFKAFSAIITSSKNIYYFLVQFNRITWEIWRSFFFNIFSNDTLLYVSHLFFSGEHFLIAQELARCNPKFGDLVISTQLLFLIFGSSQPSYLKKLNIDNYLYYLWLNNFHKATACRYNEIIP
jgi:hypothetical protein